jgi:hypothetical protein
MNLPQHTTMHAMLLPFDLIHIHRNRTTSRLLLPASALLLLPTRRRTSRLALLSRTIILTRPRRSRLIDLRRRRSVFVHPFFFFQRFTHIFVPLRVLPSRNTLHLVRPGFTTLACVGRVLVFRRGDARAFSYTDGDSDPGLHTRRISIRFRFP